MPDCPGLVGQIQPLALIPVSGHRVRELDVDVFFLDTNFIGLAAFFPSNSVSMQLSQRASDRNAPNKPSYGDNADEEE